MTRILLFLSAIAFPLLAMAGTEHARAIEASRALIEALVREARLPGFSVAVSIDGELAWSEGFGYADLEQRVPVTPLSRFRIGSVSKTLTASAIGLLLERKQVDLDAPVHRYIRGFPEKQWPITVRQLGGHTAGIRHYREGEFLSSSAYRSVSDALSVFAHDALQFRPGTAYLYSTYGWTLVSAAIEGASGEEFLSYMQRELFEPLGMSHTVAERMSVIIPDRVRFYERGQDSKPRNAVYVDTSSKWAGGGFLSTPEDLVRFGNGHLQGRLLGPDTRRLLTTTQRIESGAETGYGIGWEVRTDVHGRPTIGHSGGSVGGSTMFVVWPELSMVVAATTNLTEDPGVRLVAYALGEYFHPATPTLPPTHLKLSGERRFRLHSKGTTVFGRMLLETTAAGYGGSVTASPIIPFGRIVWGADEPGGVHLLVTTALGLFHFCLSAKDEQLEGQMIGPDGEWKVGLQ